VAEGNGGDTVLENIPIVKLLVRTKVQSCEPNVERYHQAIKMLYG
jgi:hypothetical protein